MSGTHIVNVGAPCLLERFTKIVLRKLTIIVGIIVALSVNSRFARGGSTSSLWFQFVSKGKQFLSRFTRFWKVVVQYVIQVCYFGVATNMLILSMTVFGFYFFVKLKCYISICFRWILFREPVRFVYLTITLCPCRPTEGLQNERIRWIAAQTNNPRSVFSDTFSCT